MKKLFFFKSSSSNSGGRAIDSPPSRDKQVFQEMPFESELNNQVFDKAKNSFQSIGVFSKAQKQASDSLSSIPSSALRRSRSYSSATFLGEGLEKGILSSTGDHSRSPSSSTSRNECNNSSRWRALIPERQFKPKHIDADAVQNANRLERPSSSHSHTEFSANSSSSNASTKVLDRYIDGEQQQERSKSRKSSRINHTANGLSGGRLPPRVQYTAPASPTDGVKDKTRSHSFREAKGTRLQFSSRDWVERGIGHESPRRLAKNVIERLSQTNAFPKSSSEEFDHDNPITLEDIYGEPDTRYFDSHIDVPAPKSYSSEEPYDTIDNYGCHFPSFQKQSVYVEDNDGGLNSVQIEDVTDVELQQRSKEAEERIVRMSEELDQETFLPKNGFDVPSLFRCIRKLMEDKISLAIEVSGLLKSRIDDRDYAKEELRSAKAELESQTRRLEKEKNELQSALEKELDRRSTDWSLKLDKYQLEEQRLRERVRELAEQNVSLQREVSFFNERETESKSVIAYSKEQLSHLTERVEELSKENQDLKEKLSESQAKFTAAEETLDCVKRNFEEKDEDCKEQQKSIVRLLRTCSDQEKTIEGLREGFKEQIEKQALEKPDKHVAKMLMEQMRLTGVELALRREVESQRLEIDSLRHENINLLNRVKGNWKEIGALSFKLDKELWSRTCHLENQGLSILNGSTQLCSKLLEYIKGKLGQLPENKHSIDGQFILESDVKVKGFKRGTESLTRSLRMASSLLQEKSNLVPSKSLSSLATDGFGKINHLKSEEALKVELKEEILLTSLLREKLYSKELEVEQLHAELAAAVRGNDILRCEFQNAQDSLSCANHKLRDSELQILKKDETVNRVQNILEDSTRELTMMKGMLSKVSQERDLMWDEVKQYNEKNMLLNSEINMLKRKIEALDEDVLLKEGQITILKDALGKRPFDLLGSPDSTPEFLL